MVVSVRIWVGPIHGGKFVLGSVWAYIWKEVWFGFWPWFWSLFGQPNVCISVS